MVFLPEEFVFFPTPAPFSLSVSIVFTVSVHKTTKLFRHVEDLVNKGSLTL